jgi:type VI secretion system protein ImpF
VSVKAVAGGVDHNKLTFEIEADLWAQPYPERLYLKTEFDLERLSVAVTESNGRSVS